MTCLLELEMAKAAAGTAHTAEGCSLARMRLHQVTQIHLNEK